MIQRSSFPEATPYDEAFDAIWEAHVQQLVPCAQCGRTFFPDRIEVHIKWCKGNNAKTGFVKLLFPYNLIIRFMIL